MNGQERTIPKSAVIPHAVQLGRSLSEGCCNTCDIPSAGGHLLPSNAQGEEQPSCELQGIAKAKDWKRQAHSYGQAGMPE